MSEQRILLPSNKKWNMQCVCSNTIFAYSFKCIVIRSILSKKIIRIFQKQGLCCAISLSPKGWLIATGQKTGVCLWDIYRGTKVRQVQLGFPSIIVHSPYGQYIGIALDAEKIIQLWDNQIQQIMNIFTIDGSFICDLKFSPCGTMLAASDSNNCLYVWAINGQKRKEYKLPPTQYHRTISALAYSPNGLELALINVEKLIIWDIFPNYKLVQRYIQESSGSKLCYSQTGKILIAGQWSQSQDSSFKCGPWCCLLVCSPNYRYLITSESQYRIRIIKCVNQDLVHYRLQNPNQKCIFVQPEKYVKHSSLTKKKPLRTHSHGTCTLL